LWLAVLAGVAMAAGAQISPGPGDLSPRDAATKAKVLKALEGVRFADDLAFFFDRSRAERVTVRSRRGGSNLLVEVCPMKPTEAEVLARSERILTRLGYRKGIDFEHEFSSALPDAWSPEWTKTRPEVGGQLIRFRRPADRGFYDENETFQLEWDLQGDQLVALSVPGLYMPMKRVAFSQVLTVQDAAGRASRLFEQYQRQNRAFWMREDASPATLLKNVEAKWMSASMLSEFARPRDLSRVPAPRTMEVPVYRFRHSGQMVFVRADTGDAVLPYFGAWSSPAPLGQQWMRLGLTAPRLSEFLAASAAGFWILGPLLLIRTWRKRQQGKRARPQAAPGAEAASPLT
jgi:hypothetical protein